MRKENHQIKIWDPVVRILHWGLVAAFFLAIMTEDDFLGIHVFAGYLVLGIVLFRILWGLIGTRHARFFDFVFSPRVVRQYIKDMLLFKAPRYLGHGPAGGTMVLALLISLLLTTFSGLMVYGGQEYAGPLANMMIGMNGFWAEVGEGFHEFFAGLTLFLVCIHVVGVLFSSLLHRENLIKAMFTGYKRADHTRTEKEKTKRNHKPTPIHVFPNIGEAK